jgi:hypothetical protein
MEPEISRLVSGGQTGVDRAALDVALEHGIPCGGWCPRGRRAEDGAVPAVYPLTETPLRNYRQRTAWNVRDSDATLVLAWGRPTGGTRFTVNTCREQGKPYRVEDLADPATWAPEAIADVRHWLVILHAGHIVNVAGPRESTAPGIHARAMTFLREVLGTEGTACGEALAAALRDQLRPRPPRVVVQLAATGVEVWVFRRGRRAPEFHHFPWEAVARWMSPSLGSPPK